MMTKLYLPQLADVLLLSSLIFFQMLLSASANVTGSMLLLRNAAFFLILSKSLFNFLSSKFTIKDFGYLLLLLAAIFTFFMVGNFNIMSAIIVGLFAYTMSGPLILWSYLGGAGIGTLCLFFSSLVGVLSLRDPIYGTILLGFKNPNALGFVLIAMLLSYKTLKWDKRTPVFWLLSGVNFLFVYYALGDKTAAGILVGYTLQYMIFKKRDFISKTFIGRCFFLGLPMALTFITFWLANNYSRYDFIYKVNSVVTQRPWLWHYNLSIYSFKMFGNIKNGLDMFVINTVGTNALDGAYIYAPLMDGILATIIIGVVIFLSSLHLLTSRKTSYIVLFVCLLLSGFSENMILSSYQTPFLMLAFFFCGSLIGSYGESRQKNGRVNVSEESTHE